MSVDFSHYGVGIVTCLSVYGVYVCVYVCVVAWLGSLHLTLNRCSVVGRTV